jgi:FlaA1/EpsC-like NDP-sugar epimerase
MSIDAAVSLVLEITASGFGGNLYILDMGKPVSIVKLAKKLMKYYNKEVPIVFTELKNGEKLHEKLFSEDEELVKTNLDKIFSLIKKDRIKNIDRFLVKIKSVCFYNPLKSRLFRNRKYLKSILSNRFSYLKTFNKEREY